VRLHGRRLAVRLQRVTTPSAALLSTVRQTTLPRERWAAVHAETSYRSAAFGRYRRRSPRQICTGLDDTASAGFSSTGQGRRNYRTDADTTLGGGIGLSRRGDRGAAGDICEVWPRFGMRGLERSV